MGVEVSVRPSKDVEYATDGRISKDGAGARHSKDGAAAPPPRDPHLESALSKTGRRIVPLFMLITMANHMDRSKCVVAQTHVAAVLGFPKDVCNGVLSSRAAAIYACARPTTPTTRSLSYAALTFNRDLGFTAQTYAMGTALFSIGFMLCMGGAAAGAGPGAPKHAAPFVRVFSLSRHLVRSKPTPIPRPHQLPSNLLMVRVGARGWLGFLLVSWGAVAASMAAVQAAWSFYLLRALLGVFEAGAMPGMMYYLTTVYPRSRWAGGAAAAMRAWRCGAVGVRVFYGTRLPTGLRVHCDLTLVPAHFPLGWPQHHQAVFFK